MNAMLDQNTPVVCMCEKDMERQHGWVGVLVSWLEGKRVQGENVGWQTITVQAERYIVRQTDRYIMGQTASIAGSAR